MKLENPVLAFKRASNNMALTSLNLFSKSGNRRGFTFCLCDLPLVQWVKLNQTLDQSTQSDVFEPVLRADSQSKHTSYL